MNKGQVNSVQLLRAVAALGVVVLHARGVAHDGAYRLGAAGVDLFFVISGFIIAGATAHSPGEFLWRRFWRIYPVWWLVAAAALPLSIAAGKVDGWQDYAATATLWPLWGARGAIEPGVGWTLTFEITFYAAMALAMATRFWVPLALFALAFALRHSGPLFAQLGNPLVFEFLAGVVIARLPRPGPRLGAALLGAALLLFWFSPAAMIYQSGYNLRLDTAPRALHWGIPAALMLYGALGLERYCHGRFMRLPLLLGSASYAIYLTHWWVIEQPVGGWMMRTLAAALVGLIVHVFIEQPIARRRPPSPAALVARLRTRMAAPRIEAEAAIL